MTNIELAPIALFVYNRPELTLRTLEHLARNEELARSALFVFCDGPKIGATAEQLNQIARVQEIIRSRPWAQAVHIEQSEKNKGLANSIITGVTKTVEKYGRVIVVEDDLAVAPFFLQYMNKALHIYEKEKKVLAIHGYLYPVDLGKRAAEDTFFIRDPGCWGWATWQRAWKLFEPDTKKLYDLMRLKGLSHAFDFWGGYPYMRMMRQQMTGKVDSWAVRWRAVAYLHDMFTLHPVRSLVRHDGNVPEATHYRVGENDNLYTEITEQPVEVEKIPIVANEEIERLFGRFLKKYSGMSISSKIKNRLRNMFAKDK